tara:strand:- start:750 stop:1334 length:585 start_codon:yes stop_codon:yes gene_type:complete
VTIRLRWKGPVGPKCIPNDPLIFENLCQAGVYLRVKTYQSERIVVYVGQSNSLLSRFDQHLSGMLGLATPLRDSSGELVFAGDATARLMAYNNLKELAPLATADAQRVKFFYAMCDHSFLVDYLNVAECLLQDRLAQKMSYVENVISAPKRLPNDVPDDWENDFSGLEEFDRHLFFSMLGEESMRFETASENGV